MDPETLRRDIAAVPFWFHSIDLGAGIVTPGSKKLHDLEIELAALRLPDLRGKSVIDIGAWDGFYSFTAEAMGASRVVALDHFVWGLDWIAKREYKAQRLAQGATVMHYETIAHLWQPHSLPGKRGFDIAHAALGSKVQPVVADFMATDIEQLGKFDVSLYLGVLYHMRNPLEALMRLRKVTRGLAIIETLAIYIRGVHIPVCEFFPPDAKPSADPTNFWAPNAEGLVAMCRAAGFRSVELLSAPPRTLKKQAHYRLVAHARTNS